MNERTLTIPAELASVRTARLFARDVVLGWDLSRLADDVQLGTSELVTNAVQHARSEVLLVLRLKDQLVVEAHDAEPELSRPPAAQDLLAASGRGLAIIEAISSDWGVRQSPRGKAVWFALPLPLSTPDADVFSLASRRPVDRSESRTPARRSAGAEARARGRAAS